MNLRIPAIIMIVPTLAVALMISWQTRHMKSELYHNIAIDFWIVANCTWMVGEFFGWDENLFQLINTNIGLRQLAIIPFSIGLGVLAFYYLVYKRKQVAANEDKIYIQTAPEDIEDLKKVAR